MAFNKHRRVAVSQLARYAEDPEAFVRHRGGVESRAAVRHGNRYHNRLGRSRFSGWRLVLAVIALLVVAYLVGVFRA